MKRVFNNPLFMFVLGVIISGGIVYATTISAENITYKNGTLKSALDDLYSKAGNSFNGMTLVDKKSTHATNGSSASLSYSNLSKGTYFLYAIRTISSNPSTDVCVSSSVTGTDNGVPVVTVSSGSVSKLDNEFNIITVTQDNATITINSSNPGSSQDLSGYLYTSLFLMD